MNPKIARDPFYRELYLTGGEEALREAGFFIDNAPDNFRPEETLDILCTPITFIKEKLVDVSNPCVLLATGALAPIHDGHIDMMKAARVAAEKAGWDVVAGFFAPDHDEYINRKITEREYDIHTRIYLANQAVKDSDWMRVDPWAGLFMNHTINFTDVLRRLELYIEKHLDRKIPVFFIAGGDNAGFVRTFEHRGHCIIVSRPSYEPKVDKFRKYFDGKRLLLGHSPNTNSSTKVRRNQKTPLKSSKRELILRMDNHRVIDLAVKRELEKHFEVVTIPDFKIQENYFKATSKLQSTISLDPLLRGEFNLNLSRNYDLFGMNRLGFTSRPGYETLEEQISKIPKGKYRLFDDDIHSGNTVKYVTELLNESGRKVIGVDALTYSNDEQEILDCRDFLFAAPNSGLVIEHPTGQKIRQPYIYPFVNPFVRASIEDSLTFSRNIWKLNMDFYRQGTYYNYCKEQYELLAGLN